MRSPMGRNGNGHSFEVTTESDVYKMLQDTEEPVSAPKQSGSFKYLQGILEAEDGGTLICCSIRVSIHPTVYLNNMLVYVC